MKKSVIEQTTNIPAGTVIGLTDSQASDRMHNLQKAEAKGLPGGINAYTAKTAIQFKAGEIVYLGKVPKSVILGIVGVDESGEAPKAKTVKPAKTKEKDPEKPKKKTGPELRKILTDAGIDHSKIKGNGSNAKLAELVEKVQAHDPK